MEEVSKLPTTPAPGTLRKPLEFQETHKENLYDGFPDYSMGIANTSTDNILHKTPGMATDPRALGSIDIHVFIKECDFLIPSFESTQADIKAGIISQYILLQNRVSMNFKSS